MKSGIYAIINKVNNKIYIGSSVNIFYRFKNHISKLNTRHHENNYLQNAFIKYGISCFYFVILEFCENLKEKENFYLNYFKSYKRKYGYNIIVSSERKRYSPELRKRISVGLKKFYASHEVSAETRNKISKANKGKKHTIKICKNISKKLSGRKLSKTTIEKIRTVALNRSLETRKKMRAAKLGNKNPNFGKKKSEETKKKISFSLMGNTNRRDFLLQSG